MTALTMYRSKATGPAGADAQAPREGNTRRFLMFDAVTGRPRAATTSSRTVRRGGSEIEEVSRMHTVIGFAVRDVGQDHASRTRSKYGTADLRTLCPTLTQALPGPISISEGGQSADRRRVEIRRHGWPHCLYFPFSGRFRCLRRQGGAGHGC